MKRYILTVLISGAATIANAQQLQTSSLYDLQGIFYNPSLAGINQNADVKSTFGLSYRTQWEGISGSPKTMTAFGSVNIPNQNMGIGGYIYNDVTGPTSRKGIQLAFAKHIPTANGGNFSIGIEAKVQQYSLNQSKLEESLGNDPVLGSSNNKINFDAGFGISYTDSKFQAGVSVAQLIQSKLDFYTGNLQRTDEARLYRHYYGHALYNWDVDGYTVITPNVLVTYLPNAPTEFQGGVRFEHGKSFFWGLAVRARQSWMLSAGVHIQKRFTLGYSFDMYRTPLSTFDGGSNAHEILLKFDILK